MAMRRDVVTYVSTWSKHYINYIHAGLMVGIGWHFLQVTVTSLVMMTYADVWTSGLGFEVSSYPPRLPDDIKLCHSTPALLPTPICALPMGGEPHKVIALLPRHHRPASGTDMKLRGSISRLKKKAKSRLSRGRPEPEKGGASSLGGVGPTNSHLQPKPHLGVVKGGGDDNSHVGGLDGV